MLECARIGEKGGIMGSFNCGDDSLNSNACSALQKALSMLSGPTQYQLTSFNYQSSQVNRESIETTWTWDTDNPVPSQYLQQLQENIPVTLMGQYTVSSLSGQNTLTLSTMRREE